MLNTIFDIILIILQAQIGVANFTLMVSGLVSVIGLGVVVNDRHQQIKMQKRGSLTLEQEYSELLALKEENVQLKETVNDLELENTKHKAVLNAFLQNIGHEVRTPLNGLIGVSNLLLSELDGKDDETICAYSEAITQSSSKLIQLFENILDMSILEVSKYKTNRNKVDLRDVVDRAVFEAIPALANKDVFMVCNNLKEPANVWADKEVLNKIVRLVTDNAIKFTKSGKITIETKTNSADNEQLLIIQDTGCGISEEFLPMAFEPFLQESTGNARQYQGAGLGLSIVRELTHLMDGKLEIQSVKGVGTTILLRFPALTVQNKKNKKESLARPSFLMKN